MNRWEIRGRLGRDPETSTLKNGQRVTRFSVAVSNNYFDKKSGQWVEKDATWVKCSVWGDDGEEVVRNFYKGDMIEVVGKAGIEEWTPKDGGEKTCGLTMPVSDVKRNYKASKKRNSSPKSSPGDRQRQAPKQQSGTRRPPKDEDFDAMFGPTPDDQDIPF